MACENYSWGWVTLKIEAEYFRVFARHDLVDGNWDNEHIFVGVTGRDSNDKNGAIIFDGADEEEILAAVAAVRSKNFPSSLFFVDRPCSSIILQRLAVKKITPDQTSICMAVKIDDTLDRSINPNVEIKEIFSSDLIEEWLNVAEISGWLSDEEPEKDRRIQGRCLKSLIDSKQAKFCTAHLDGNTVGMAGMFIHDKNSLLTDLAVLPKFQRQLVGATLMNWWIDHCRNDSVEKLVLAPTPDSRKLYENFGLREYPVPPDAIFYMAD